FLSECSRLVTRRVLSIFWVLALFFPPAYYIILSLNRELLSFVLLLSAATCLLSYRRTHAIRPMIGGGLLLGLLSLFYSPYLFLPVFLLPLLLIWRTRFTHIAIFFALWLLVLFPWGLRNTLEVGRPCITGCYRSAVTWYVRGEQAEYIRGLTPLRCLWAEYISRDWSVVPPQCSFNAVMHAHWPKGLPLSDEDRVSGIAGQQKILANLPSYLSYSVFEILELHVPYVNEWGRFYNIFTVLGTVILYLGCLFGLRRLFTDRTFWLLLSIMVYTVLVFILTDATPRYLMPAIFCYFVVGATGFDRLFVFCERTK
ncbi:hypothetical protein HZA45_01110, partial [Candidatus Peregrinibacteria bacterium]|nr:hypothetical protein [Candidatus Peregrinibacteria bacterium]